MKKTLLILSFSMFASGAIEVMAQDKAETITTERSEENLKKEADALEQRIEQYTIKVEANKDNSNVDYEAEQVRIAEWKAKWESLTGKTWAEHKKEK